MIKYEELKQKIIAAKNAYYNSETPLLTDDEYDTIWFIFKTNFPDDDLCKSIGTPPSSVTEWKKKKHQIPMSSLDKINKEEEFIKWSKKINDNFYIEMEKLDGISIDLVYESGILVDAITRGDGMIGESILSNVKKMKNVKHEINSKEIQNLRGEILIFQKDFEDINKILTQSKKNILENPRNATTGISKRYDGKFSEYCTILYYDCDKEFETIEDKMNFIESLNLKTCWWEKVTKEQIIKNYNFYNNEKRIKIPYDIDGLVISCNSQNLIDEFGYNSNNLPNFSIAWKFPPMKVKTKIINVEWQLGNGGEGRLTPVANLETVKCGGVNISHATLHNLEIFKSLNLQKKDIVEISRRNDVIPYIEKNLTNYNDSNLKFKEPDYCPVCNYKTEIQGKFLICPNINCKGKEIGNLNRWINALNIMDISNKTIELFYNNNLIKKPSDFYSLKINDILNLERMGIKSAKKIIKNIQDKIDIDLSTFVEGLNIPHFSKSRAELLIKNNFNTLEKILNITKKDLLSIKGIEEKISEKIILGLQSKKEIIFELLHYINIKEINLCTKLSGLSFCVTGSLETMDRKEFKSKVIQNSGEYKSSITKTLSYLVTNDTESGTGKNKKAKENNVKIINEQEFISMIEN